jgi:hypothetical protein
MTIVLLSLDDVASMYRVTRRYARDYLVKTPGFPAPVAGSTRKNPLWLEDKLKEYMLETSRTELAHS